MRGRSSAWHSLLIAGLIMTGQNREGLSAWLGGAVFDLTGGYRPAFAMAVGALATGAASVWLTYGGKRSGR